MFDDPSVAEAEADTLRNTSARLQAGGLELFEDLWEAGDRDGASRTLAEVRARARRLDAHADEIDPRRRIGGRAR